MKNKFLVGLGGLALVLATAPMFAAFEAHVVNVTAQVENGVLTVPTSISYGTVFPQERLDRTFDVNLTESFLSEPVGTQYASAVVSSNQGKRKNGTNILADRTDPTDALGAPQSTGTPYDNPVVNGSFFSLGFNSSTGVNFNGGSIVLSFTNFIVDVPGSDITVYEITGGTSYPDERVRVEASQDGNTWFVLATSSARDVNADLAVGGLAWAKFVRITDVSDRAIFEATGDGYDLDAVRATSRERIGIIDYMVRQKPKCGLPVPQTSPVQYSSFGLVTESATGTFMCADQGYVMLPLLCPYLSKHELTKDGAGENDSNGINAFHGLPLPWNMSSTIATQVLGALSAPSPDLGDTWNVDLRVPCFKGSCAQDWPDFVKRESGNPQIDPEMYKADPALEHELFGCDLWVEVTNIQ